MGTHTTDDIVVIGEMGLAALAAVDLVAIEIRVVGETHGDSDDVEADEIEECRRCR